jgi:hypothetical protein
MNTAEPGHVVKDLCHKNWLRMLRKPFQCLAYIRVPPEVRFQVENATCRMVFSERFQEEMGDGDHEQREVRRMVHRGLLHVHTILQPPLLLGIPEVKLDVEAKTVIIHACFVTEGHITTQQHDMGPGVSLEIDRDDDDDMQ